MKTGQEPMVFQGEKNVWIGLLWYFPQAIGYCCEGSQMSHLSEDYRKDARIRSSEKALIKKYSKGSWYLFPGGKLLFMPLSIEPWDYFPVEGNFYQNEYGIRFHACKRTEHGTTITLDGILHPLQEGYRLDAIDTVAGRTGMRVARISQPLTHMPSIMYDERLREKILPKPKILVDTKNPAASVFDLDFPIFDALICGETEYGPFQDIPATLIFNRDGDNIQLVLASQLEITCNGWIVWITGSLDKSHFQGRKVSVTYPIDPSPYFSWYVGEEGSGDYFCSIPDHAHLIVSIETDEEIGGTIEAVGTTVRQDKTHPCRLRAKFTGKWRGANVDQLRRSLNRVTLDGRWKGMEPLRSLTLNVKSGTIDGGFDNRKSGELTGNVADRHAYLTWHGLTGTRGWGFLAAAANHEVLVGLYGENGKIEGFREIIAVPFERSFPSLEAFSQKDALELRYLGRELIDQGRLEIGEKVLKRALELEYEIFKELGASSYLKESNLVRIISILVELVPLCFQRASYDSLLDVMIQAVTIHRMLGPEEYSKDICLQQIDELERDYRKNKETLYVVIKNLENFRYHVRKSSLDTPVAVALHLLWEAAENIDRDIDRIAILEEEVAQGKRLPLEILNDLLQLCQHRRDSLIATTNAFLGLGKEIYVKCSTLIDRRDEVLAECLPVDTDGKEPPDNGDISLRFKATVDKEKSLDADLGQNVNLSTDEKAFFQGQMQVGSSLLGFVRSSGIRSGYIERLRVEEQARIRWAQTTKSVKELANYIEKWRSRLLQDQEKINQSRKTEPFLKKQVQLLVDLHAEEQALVASEASRSRAFADLLAARSRVRQSRDLAFASGRDLPSPESIPPLGLEEIRSTARVRGGTLIEYFLLEDGVVSWVFCPDNKISMIRNYFDVRGFTCDVHRLTDLFVEGLCTPGDGHQRKEEVKDLLKKLDRILMEPLRSRGLLPTDPDDPITIIPHDVLFRIPFSALLDRADRYLIEKHTLTYSSAFSVLKYTQQWNVPKVSRPPKLVAFVNPTPLPCSNKVSLDETVVNFKYIKEMYDRNQVFTGQEATVEALFENASSADVLYFATHAKADEEDSLNSYVALAVTPTHGGYLRTSDIYAMHLQAELVVLAACETGRGEITGDGVNGLNRAFTWAGARSLLLTLWAVPESQTLALLYEFHENWIRKRRSKAHAIRKAQIALMKQYRDQPNVWSGFVLYGESN